MLGSGGRHAPQVVRDTPPLVRPRGGRLPLHRRWEWGRVSLTRENLLPFLYKLPYSLDLHRSGGVLLGLLVLLLAITSVGMDLNREVLRPVVPLVSKLTSSHFADRPRGAAG